MTGDARFAIIWITLTLLIWAGLVPLFVWAIKTRQFSQQDRARHLALQSRSPADVRAPEQEPSRRNTTADGGACDVSP